MPLTLDDLDSPIIQDVQSSFVGGQLSNATPVQVGQDTACLLEDVQVQVTGQAQLRRGTAQLGNDVDSGVGTPIIRAVGFYNTPTNTYPVATGITKARFFNGSTWADLGVITLRNTTHPAVYVEGNAYLYATDGLDNIRRWDGTTWTDVNTDTPPTEVKYLIWHTNRLIAANATIGGSPSPDGVFFSGILADNEWATIVGGNQLQPGAGNGQAITALVPWTNFNVAVFKEASTWMIDADPQLDVASMPVTMVHGRIGCLAPLTAVQVGADIFFLSNDGVRSLNQTFASANQYQLGLPISFPVDDIIKRINFAAVGGACAIFWKGLYLLAIPLDSSSTNNYIMIWNSVISKWTGGWTNLPVACFGIRTDSDGIDRLMMGSSVAFKVFEYLDYIQEADANNTTYTDYDGTYVSPHIISRGMMFGDLDSPKKGLNVNMKLNKSIGTMDVNVIFDEGASTVNGTVDTGIGNSLSLPFNLPATLPRLGIQPLSMTLRPYPKFNQMQVELKGTSAGYKEIRQITAQAFPEAMDLKGKFVVTSQTS